VQGGTFSRDFDGVYYTDPKLTATVSDFRLDKYEVTVGRFRKFVDAVVGGWTPAAGSGKHAHLNGGSGLAASAGGFEPGWDTAWNANLPSSKATWESSSFLACSSAGADSGPTNGAWTSAAAANEKRPINCVNWYQASAFCIWDGGFLPSETEWTYAAAGGNEHRVYPWSRPPTSGKIDSSLATFCNSSMCPDPQRKTDTGPVGSKAAGNGRYGQADLAGNVWEWAVDSIANPRNTSCTDCAELGASSDRVIRGGSVVDAIPFLQVSLRYAKAPTARSYYFGARCARRP
jgi:formylglycine-generating enzyme required for sulfatase activity